MLTLAALATLALAWDIVQAGHIAQQRRTPPGLTILAGLVVLVAAPAVLVAAATGSAVTGYSLSGIAWIWPMTVALFLAESLYVTLRRLVTPLIGVPIAVYNALLLAVAVTRYVEQGGGTPPPWALALAAGYIDVLGSFAGPTALTSPWAMLVPLIAPAFPAAHATGRALRGLVAILSTISIGALVLWWPAGDRAVASYDRYLAGTLQERPGSDFLLGMQILPPLDGPPPAAALHNDLALVDSTGAEAVSVIIEPGGSHPTALDSLARVLDPLRRDSTTVFITVGPPSAAPWHDRSAGSRLNPSDITGLRRIAQRLHPDYLVLPNASPASGSVGSPIQAWTRDLGAAADSIHTTDRRIKVAIAISAFDARDSVIYAWAASPASPIDVIGFVLLPGLSGAPILDARMKTADRWLERAGQPPKEHWVLATGGYPAAHGESSQQLAIWGTLAWATSRNAIKGAIITDAGDYNDITGLRAATGRLRPAALAVVRAAKELRDRRN